MSHTISHNHGDIACVYREVDWSAASWSGVIAGVVFIMMPRMLTIAPAVFPWFTRAQNRISALNHGVFGMALAGTYVALRKPSAEA